MGEGDELQEGVEPADIVFVIQEKPHAHFTRDGHDLVLRQRLTLRQALLGANLGLTSIYGEPVKLELRDVVQPGSQRRIANQGMPDQKNPSKRGDLVVKFDVVLPSQVPAARRDALKEALKDL